MSTKNDEPSVVRGFRLPATTLSKLDTLAQRTGRTRASMLIVLIDLAETTGLPDVRLRVEPPSPPSPTRAP